MPLLGNRSPMQRAGLLAPGSYFQDLATWSKINFLYAPRVIAEVRQVRREARRPELFARLLTVLEHNHGPPTALGAARGVGAPPAAPRADTRLAIAGHGRG